MKMYKKIILEKLLDKYELSKTFIGVNVVKQTFKIELAKEFPEFADDSKIIEIQQISDAANELEEEGLIACVKRKNGLLYALKLNDEKIEECYLRLKRKPKKEVNSELFTLLNDYAKGDDIVNIFSRTQIERINGNKKPEHFNGSVEEYAKLLKVLSEITNVRQETFVRDFSIKVLGDSKSFEKMKVTVLSILDQYGDFPDREMILQDLNIIKNPGHVFFKGNGTIQISSQEIDLNVLKGDIAISSPLIKNIEKIKVTGKSVVSVENLTTFNTYRPNNEFVLYLGGYHNSIRRNFIKLLYAQNPDIEYYHYGDIDAGGFNILLHLRRKTGVPFKPLHMDVETLIANREYTKTLKENDVKRLKKIQIGEFDEVIAYMLEHNCKLEQEALD